jgi:hypothetical protein
MTVRRSNIENGLTTLIIDGEQIAKVTTMKYLGVEIDEKLDFKQHVDTTIRKMAHHIWITAPRFYFSQSKNT